MDVVETDWVMGPGRTGHRGNAGVGRARLEPNGTDDGSRAIRERETSIRTRPSSTGTHVRTSPRTETTRLFDLCFVSVPVDDKESPLSSPATHSGLDTTWDHS